MISDFVLRFRALLGAMADALDRAVRHVVPFLPGRLPGAVPVALILGGLAWMAATSTSAAIERRPEPATATVQDLVEDRVFGWVSVRGALSGPHTAYTTPLDGIRRHIYVLRDADAPDEFAIVMRSTLDGSAMRQRVADGEPIEGVLGTDLVRMRQLLAEPDLAAALAGTDFPPAELLLEGVRPPFEEATYLPAIVLGGITGFLVLSILAGYPVFRRLESGPSMGAAALAVGEELPLEIHGRFRVAGAGTVALRGEPGVLGWLAAADAARTAWRFGQGALTHAAHADASEPQLVLRAAGASFAWHADPRRDALRRDAGKLATATGVRPAIRLRGEGVNAALTFEDHGLVPLAASLLDPSALPAQTPSGLLVDAADATDAAERSARARERQRAGALALVLGGAAVVAHAVVGLASTWPIAGLEGAVVGAGIEIAVGAGVIAVGAGQRRERPLAVELAPSVAVMGLLIALLAAAAAPLCGAWVAPTSQACPTPSPVGILLVLAAGVAFGFSLWTLLDAGRARLSA